MSMDITSSRVQCAWLCDLTTVQVHTPLQQCGSKSGTCHQFPVPRVSRTACCHDILQVMTKICREGEASLDYYAMFKVGAHRCKEASEWNFQAAREAWLTDWCSD
eukprot:scaffold167658_cov20-Tisochrysis_lutea.AAC.2